MRFSNDQSVNKLKEKNKYNIRGHCKVVVPNMAVYAVIIRPQSLIHFLHFYFLN